MSPRRAAAVGWTIFACSIALGLGSIWIAAANAASVSPRDALDAATSKGAGASATLVVAAFGLVGALIVSRQPRNGVGWLFLVDAVLISLSVSTFVYGYRGLVAEPGSVLGAEVAAWISDMLYLPLLAALTAFLFVLYPDGTIKHTLERRIAFLASVGVILGLVGSLITPQLYGYPEIGNPAGIAAPSAVFGTIVGIASAMVIGAAVASVISLVRRYRRSRGRERDQLRLLLWSAVIGISLLAPSFFAADPSLLLQSIGLVGVLLIPLSVGVGILRFRLFDMDLVVRRAFVFGVLAAFITLVYVVVVIAIPAMILGPSEVSGFGLLPFVAAAVIAIAFQPVRGWARRLAARTVYGERATPYEVMSELAERMGESFGEDDLLPRIARAIGEGTRAERADVWLRVGAQLRHAANWPGDQEVGSMIPLIGEDLPEGIPGDTAVPVIDRGEILGALSLSEAPGESVSDAERRLLDGVASQAGVALRNIRLTEELRDNLAQLMASRQRLVTAQDEQRRKLERDIHDGAQQQLVAMSVKAKLAETMLGRDPDVARRIVGELRAESQEALESLRDLARGIYPPLLADEGIAAALEAQARRSPVDVTVRAEHVGRESQDVEAAVYFCCLEALQNIAKYANARSVEVVLRRSDGVLSFEVRDDGDGFDPETTKRGTGLQNMADRVEALGGEVEVRTGVGAGTTVAGVIPVASGTSA